LARLVIVSNRVGTPGGTRTAGGLVVALQDALRDRGGVWVGWSGETVPGEPGPPKSVRRGRVTYVTLDLAREAYEAYYAGFANGTLWPLFHYRLGLIAFRRRDLEGYLAVNERFARTIAELLRPDDLVWVHDYHFLALGAALRRLGVANRLGFFLHIPFPAPEVLRALPGHERLLRALADYDLLGFQTGSDARCAAEGLERLVGARPAGEGRWRLDERTVTIGAFPVGIDTEGFARLAAQSANGPEARRLAESLAGRALVLGVDRLDYSKGLPGRLQAVAELLEHRPQWRRRITYLQIAPVSRGELRQYRALRSELEALAGRTNARFADVDWTPVRWVNRNVPRAVLAGYLRLARVGFVTPLRDGMNLVAKEYVAAQDPEDPGVLVLSRLAGAAEELASAVLVDPLDVEGMAEALDAALAMPLDERRARWAAAIAVLRENTAARWRTRFLEALEATRPAAGAAAGAFTRCAAAP